MLAHGVAIPTKTEPLPGSSASAGPMVLFASKATQGKPRAVRLVFLVPRVVEPRVVVPTVEPVRRGLRVQIARTPVRPGVDCREVVEDVLAPDRNRDPVGHHESAFDIGQVIARIVAPVLPVEEITPSNSTGPAGGTCRHHVVR